MTCFWYFTLPRNFISLVLKYRVSFHIHIWIDSETTRDFDTLRAPEAEEPISEEVGKVGTGHDFGDTFGSSLIQTNHSRTCVAVAIYPGWRKTCSIRKTRLSQVQIQEEGNIHAHNFARFPSSSTLTIHATSCKFIQHIRTSFQCRFGLLARQAMNRARCVCIVFSGQGRANAHWTAHQCLHYYIQISNMTKISNIHISFDSILYFYIKKDYIKFC